MHKVALRILVVNALIQLTIVTVFISLYIDRGFKDLIWPAVIFTGAIVYLSEFIKWGGKKLKGKKIKGEQWDWFDNKNYVKYSEWIQNGAVAVMVIVMFFKAYKAFL